MLFSRAFRDGLRDGLILLVAVFLVGTAYGVLAVQAGFAAWLTVLSSIVIVSGAAQLTMVNLLSAGTGPVLVAATGLALRHVPMSAKLAQMIGPQPLRTRLTLAWFLIDETFGLTLRASQRGETELVHYKAAVDFMLVSGWVGGTAVGAALGSGFGDWGGEIVFSLLFLGLAAPLIRSRRDWLVTMVAVAAAMASTFVLPEAWRLTGAAAFAALVGVSVRG